MPRTRRALLGGVATAATAAVAGCNLLQRGSGRTVTRASSAAWPTRYGASSGTAATDVAGVESDPTQQWPDRTLPQYRAGVFTADGGGFVLDTHTLTAVEPDGSVRWRSEDGYYPRVVLAADVVVAEAMDGGLVGLDRASGDRAWSVSGGDALAVASDRLLARTGPETVAAVAPGGGTAWSASERSSFTPVTATGDGTVVAAYTERYRAQPDTDEFVDRSTVVAYDAEGGSEQWRFSVPGPVQRVAVRNGAVHLATNVRSLGAMQYVLSLSDGSLTARVNHAKVTLDGLAVTDDHAFTAIGPTVRAYGPRLEPADWTTTLPAEVTSLAASADAVYVSWSAGRDEGTVVAALAAAGGEELWRKSLPVDWGEVVGVTDGRVFVETSETPGLYVLG